MGTVMKGREYRIIEKETGGYLCTTILRGQIVGRVHEAPDMESMMAWFRLMVGDYPNMYRGAS